jgi:hypothetical protein
MKTLIETIESVISQKKQDIKYSQEEQERIEFRKQATQREIYCLTNELESLRDYEKQRFSEMNKCGSDPSVVRKG